MNNLLFLVPIAIGMGLVGLASFFWAMRNSQFDDLDGAAARILIDDEDEDEIDSSGKRTGDSG
ncbi:cbb3-type cytochrome oxidase assembly protein CcoS [Novosphingobium sp. ZN18A2]|uniref:cbb3-type cytochrome oxidase assembly protein CcoS n=1 Tax=Novosphingobium sp. ZN18A2 TaxID=3079861 RepID=UPI0030CC289D